MAIPTVYLVGAGPGHPGLLTLRAVECLRKADLVLYDKLVSPVLLEYAPESAEKRCVTALAEHHDERILPIHDVMIAAARSGKCVVRLKGGDPLVFGRGAEEAEVLRQAGIPVEIVPGVTAALGAGAYAGISLTHRAHASAVAFVTGHENPRKPESAVDWTALARFPGTLVIYMGMSRLDRIIATLLAEGKDPQTPAAVVQYATLGTQRTLTAPLAELARRVREEGLTAPALVFIGPVVALRDELAWFERRPLFGKRVLITRPKHQAGEMVHRLVELGAVPFVLPSVEIRPLEDWRLVDQAIRSLPTYHWLVFTSANGVRAFLGRLEALGFDLRALGSTRLAAIGPKTAQALADYHLRPDIVPARFQSEDLAAALLAHIQPGQRVLLARADRGREVLKEQLETHCLVEQIAVYSQVDAVESDSEVMDALRRGEIEFVTLTSSNIARALLERLDATCRRRIEAGEIKLISISPVTSDAVRALGLPVAGEATEATTDGVIDAMV
ncbi:MAG: uroporphyrinogen-III C-methyltransferase, partial [Planctomycetes bacterium]|nr:uroporphyrinogen-III C-methyltransferase [Planctomycetota bacterium]